MTFHWDQRTHLSAAFVRSSKMGHLVVPAEEESVFISYSGLRMQPLN